MYISWHMHHKHQEQLQATSKQYKMRHSSFLAARGGWLFTPLQSSEDLTPQQ